MKIAVAFLLLGLCLVSTNAQYGKRKMLETEAFSHGRLLMIVIQRWTSLQNCQNCDEHERFCIEKEIVEDICFILNLLAADMQASTVDIAAKMNIGIPVQYIKCAMERGEIEQLTFLLVRNGFLFKFVYALYRLLIFTLKQSRLELEVIMSNVNIALGGTLGFSIESIQKGVILGGITKVTKLGGLAKTVKGFADIGAANLVANVGGLTNMASDIVGGFGKAAGNVIGSMGQFVGNDVGGVGQVFQGTKKAAGGLIADSGHLGELSGQWNNVVGVANSAGNGVDGIGHVFHGIKNAAGGLVANSGQLGKLSSQWNKVATADSGVFGAAGHAGKVVISHTNTANGLNSGISNVAGRVFGEVSTNGKGATNAAGSFFSGLSNTVGDIVGDAAHIFSKIPGDKDHVGDKVGSFGVLTGLNQLGSGVVKGGKDSKVTHSEANLSGGVGQGLSSQVSGHAGGFLSGATNFVGSFGKGTKDVFTSVIDTSGKVFGGIGNAALGGANAAGGILHGITNVVNGAIQNAGNLDSKFSIQGGHKGPLGSLIGSHVDDNLVREVLQGATNHVGNVAGHAGSVSTSKGAVLKGVIKSENVGSPTQTASGLMGMGVSSVGKFADNTAKVLVSDSSTKNIGTGIKIAHISSHLDGNAVHAGDVPGSIFGGLKGGIGHLGGQLSGNVGSVDSSHGRVLKGVNFLENVGSLTQAAGGLAGIVSADGVLKHSDNTDKVIVSDSTTKGIRNGIKMADISNLIDGGKGGQGGVLGGTFKHVGNIPGSGVGGLNLGGHLGGHLGSVGSSNGGVLKGVNFAENVGSLTKAGGIMGMVSAGGTFGDASKHSDNIVRGLLLDSASNNHGNGIGIAHISNHLDGEIGGNGEIFGLTNQVDNVPGHLIGGLEGGIKDLSGQKGGHDSSVGNLIGRVSKGSFADGSLTDGVLAVPSNQDGNTGKFGSFNGNLGTGIRMSHISSHIGGGVGEVFSGIANHADNVAESFKGGLGQLVGKQSGQSVSIGNTNGGAVKGAIHFANNFGSLPNSAGGLIGDVGVFGRASNRDHDTSDNPTSGSGNKNLAKGIKIGQISGDKEDGHGDVLSGTAKKAGSFTGGLEHLDGKLRGQAVSIGNTIGGADKGVVNFADHFGSLTDVAGGLIGGGAAGGIINHASNHEHDTSDSSASRSGNKNLAKGIQTGQISGHIEDGHRALIGTANNAGNVAGSFTGGLEHLDGKLGGKAVRTGNTIGGAVKGAVNFADQFGSLKDVAGGLIGGGAPGGIFNHASNHDHDTANSPASGSVNKNLANGIRIAQISGNIDGGHRGVLSDIDNLAGNVPGSFTGGLVGGHLDGKQGGQSVTFAKTIGGILQSAVKGPVSGNSNKTNGNGIRTHSSGHVTGGVVGHGGITGIANNAGNLAGSLTGLTGDTVNFDWKQNGHVDSAANTISGVQKGAVNFAHKAESFSHGLGGLMGSFAAGDAFKNTKGFVPGKTNNGLGTGNRVTNIAGHMEGGVGDRGAIFSGTDNAWKVAGGQTSDLAGGIGNIDSKISGPAGRTFEGAVNFHDNVESGSQISRQIDGGFISGQTRGQLSGQMSSLDNAGGAFRRTPSNVFENTGGTAGGFLSNTGNVARGHVNAASGMFNTFNNALGGVSHAIGGVENLPGNGIGVKSQIVSGVANSASNKVGDMKHGFDGIKSVHGISNLASGAIFGGDANTFGNAAGGAGHVFSGGSNKSGKVFGDIGQVAGGIAQAGGHVFRGMVKEAGGAVSTAHGFPAGDSDHTFRVTNAAGGAISGAGNHGDNFAAGGVFHRGTNGNGNVAKNAAGGAISGAGNHGDNFAAGGDFHRGTNGNGNVAKNAAGGAISGAGNHGDNFAAGGGFHRGTNGNGNVAKNAAGGAISGAGNHGDNFAAGGGFHSGTNRNGNVAKNGHKAFNSVLNSGGSGGFAVGNGQLNGLHAGGVINTSGRMMDAFAMHAGDVAKGFDSMGTGTNGAVNSVAGNDFMNGFTSGFRNLGGTGNIDTLFGPTSHVSNGKGVFTHNKGGPQSRFSRTWE